MQLKNGDQKLLGTVFLIAMENTVSNVFFYLVNILDCYLY